MKWLNLSLKRYQREELVRLVTTNDMRSMLLTTAPFDVDWDHEGVLAAHYRPVYERRVEPIDPEEERRQGSPLGAQPQPTGRPSVANNLRWPRPLIIPAHLVPRDFDDNDDEQPPGFSQKYAQQSAESFFPMPVNEVEADRFNNQLWSRPTYRARCRIWSLWQKHVKDWWFFIRYPLAFGAALAYAIATVVHLARSHP